MGWLGLEDGRPPPEEALQEVFRRFLATYGPVSREEAARWWAGITPAGAERTIGSIGDELVPVEVDGTKAWMCTDHLEGLAAAGSARDVRLLPAFDQYVIGSTKHAADLMPDGFRDRVHREAGWVSPVLAVDGRFEGVWSHDRVGERVTVTIEPFVSQPAWVRKGAEEEAERLSAFLGGALELTWNG